MNPEQQIITFLTTNRSKLQFYKLDGAVGYVKLYLYYGMPPIPDDQIRTIIAKWASVWAVGMLIDIGDPKGGSGASTPAPIPISNSEFIDAIKKKLKVLTKGVQVGNDHNNITFKATGATINLFDGGLTVGSSYTGTLEIAAKAGGLNFGGTLSSENWEITVSYPSDTVLPNAASLAKIFGDGEAAMRKLARESLKIKNITDARNASARLKPEMAAVSEAASAAMSMATSENKGGLEVGFKIGSPAPGPYQDGIPKGYEGTIVFTYRW